jgi:O-antigen ligase
MIIVLPGRGLEIWTQDTNPDNIGAWKGVFRQKNELGLNCAITFGLGLGYAPKSLLERVWRAGLMLLSVFLAYKSQSRESWVSMAVILFLALLIKPFRRLDQRSRFPVLIAASFVVVSVTALVYLNLDSVLLLLGRDRTLTGRSNIWDYAMIDAVRHPWIGYGLYGFWQTPLAYDVIVRAGWRMTSSHNSYLDVVISYGLIGLALYLPIPLMAVIYIFRAIMSYSLEIFEMFIYMLAVIIVCSFAGGFLTYTVGMGYLLALYTISNLEKVERSGFMRLEGSSS